jgi:hypothetical protein
LEFASDRGGSVLYALAIRPLLFISSLAGTGDPAKSRETTAKRVISSFKKNFKKVKKKLARFPEVQ